LAENPRIADLRRRVQKDPSSIAFAQLAEECRRAGEHQEAADICRAGLRLHPDYLSARVTLGRALLELDQLDEAQGELERVIEGAPENLAAIRGLAEVHHRRGDLPAALTHYRAALLLARNDPDLEQTIADVARQVEPASRSDAGGLTLQNMQQEMLPPAPAPETVAHVPAHDRAAGPLEEPSAGLPGAPPHDPPAGANIRPAGGGTLDAAASDRATRTAAALEHWLAAIHASRPQPRL
jgi:tetratricopeptide (TPR) repeat protein